MKKSQQGNESMELDFDFLDTLPSFLPVQRSPRGTKRTREQVDAQKEPSPTTRRGVASAQPTVQERKMIRKERNRLSAARSRTRTKELIASLKDKIVRLEKEIRLLKQKYRQHQSPDKKRPRST